MRSFTLKELKNKLSGSKQDALEDHAKNGLPISVTDPVTGELQHLYLDGTKQPASKLKKEVAK